jgi:cytochrome c peroxidase
MTVSTKTTNQTKRPSIQIPDTLPTLDTTNPAPLIITEITDRKTLLHKTIYHAKQLKTNYLTAKQLCQHIDTGFTPEQLTRIHPEDEDTPILDIPFQATWKAA